MTETAAPTLNLRRGVDYIGITCVFFCFDKDGRLLLHKRSERCRDEQGRWDVGGGALEFGESFEEAVRREIQEEYCTTPNKLQLIEAVNIIRQNGSVMTHWVAILFACELNPEEVSIGDPAKMDDIGWFSLDALPEPIHSKFHDCLTIVQKHRLA